jgi:hypothetical protein
MTGIKQNWIAILFRAIQEVWSILCASSGEITKIGTAFAIGLVKEKS